MLRFAFNRLIQSREMRTLLHCGALTSTCSYSPLKPRALYLHLQKLFFTNRPFQYLKCTRRMKESHAFNFHLSSLYRDSMGTGVLRLAPMRATSIPLEGGEKRPFQSQASTFRSKAEQEHFERELHTINVGKHPK